MLWGSFLFYHVCLLNFSEINFSSSLLFSVEKVDQLETVFNASLAYIIFSSNCFVFSPSNTPSLALFMKHIAYYVTATRYYQDPYWSFRLQLLLLIHPNAVMEPQIVFLIPVIQNLKYLLNHLLCKLIWIQGIWFEASH